MDRFGWKEKIGFAFLLLCSVVLVSRGLHDLRKSTSPAGDFETVYGMTRCMFEHCDPYDGTQIEPAFTRNGGVVNNPYPFRQHEPLYLPPALLLTAPFAAFAWGTALKLWLVAGIGSLLAGAFLIASLGSAASPLASMAGMGLLVATSLTCISTGQPSMLSIGLAAVAVWCFLKDRLGWLGVCSMAASLAYKPHVTGAVWLYFLLAGGVYRKRAIQAFVVTMVIYVAGITWASSMPQSAHWPGEVAANIADTVGRGHVADPGPHNPGLAGASSFLNLQAVASLWRDDPRWYNRIAHGIGLALLLAWAYPVLAMRAGRVKDTFALASISCLALLPLYHQGGDSRLLVLTFPAFSIALAEHKRLRWLFVVGNYAMLILLANYFQVFLFSHFVRALLPLGRWGTIFWLRQSPLVLLTLGLLYLVLFYRAMAQQKQAGVA